MMGPREEARAEPFGRRSARPRAELRARTFRAAQDGDATMRAAARHGSCAWGLRSARVRADLLEVLMFGRALVSPARAQLLEERARCHALHRQRARRSGSGAGSPGPRPGLRFVVSSSSGSTSSTSRAPRCGSSSRSMGRTTRGARVTMARGTARSTSWAGMCCGLRSIRSSVTSMASSPASPRRARRLARPAVSMRAHRGSSRVAATSIPGRAWRNAAASVAAREGRF